MPLPAKPPITLGDDGRTPTTAQASPSGERFAQPVGVFDGDDAAAGATTDAAQTDPSQAATRSSLLKGLLTVLNTVSTALASLVTLFTGGTAKVQATLTGSSVTLDTALKNVEGANGSPTPAKAVLIGGSNGANLVVPYAGAAGDSLAVGTASVPGVTVLSLWMGYNGANWDRVRLANKQASIGVTGVAAGASTTLITPSTNKKWRLVFLSIRVSVAGRYSIMDGAGGLHALYLPANETRIIPFPANFLLSAAVNNICAIKNETASNADITALALYLEE